MATRLPGAIPRRPTTTTLFTTTPPSTTAATTTPARTPFSLTTTRSANIIRRPRRPYSFTQIIQLSDGSTYTHRTTSPQALYRSTKDTRNHALWQPNDASLRNVEVDEAGKLAAFRGRFGRGWDAEAKADEEDGGAAAVSVEGAAAVAAGGAAKEGQGKQEEDGKKAAAAATPTPTAKPTSKKAVKDDHIDGLSDLISGYARPEDNIPAPSAAPKKKK